MEEANLPRKRRRTTIKSPYGFNNMFREDSDTRPHPYGEVPYVRLGRHGTFTWQHLNGRLSKTMFGGSTLKPQRAVPSFDEYMGRKARY